MDANCLKFANDVNFDTDISAQPETGDAQMAEAEAAEAQWTKRSLLKLTQFENDAIDW